MPRNRNLLIVLATANPVTGLNDKVEIKTETGQLTAGIIESHNASIACGSSVCNTSIRSGV